MCPITFAGAAELNSCLRIRYGGDVPYIPDTENVHLQ